MDIWNEVIISRRENGGVGIIILDLSPSEGKQLLYVPPGSHIDVEVSPGLVRRYSLCGDPSEGGLYRIAVLLEPASCGRSAGNHSEFTRGKRIRIGQPRNRFPLNSQAEHRVLVAGGIGITPLLSVACHLQAKEASFELPYCARSRTAAAFLDLLANSFAGEAYLHFSDGGAQSRFDLSCEQGICRTCLVGVFGRCP